MKYQVITITSDTEDPKFDKPEGEAVVFNSDNKEEARLFYEGCRDGADLGPERMIFVLLRDGKVIAAG
jgi:hypothetical protein